MPTTTITDIEDEIEQAREALAEAERELGVADAAVEDARQLQSLGLALRGATIKSQVARARRHESVELARSRIKALERILATRRDTDAADRARADAVRRQAFLAEAAALGGRVAELVAVTRTAFAELEPLYRDLNVRSGGQLLSQASAPSAYPGVYGRLIGSLEQLAQIYGKPAPKPASSAAKGAK